MIKGDVVLIKFPFTDLSGSKLRPAVVLFDSGNYLIVAFITGVLAVKSIGDISLKRNGTNGLKKDSVLKLSKLATLIKDLVAGKIGVFSDEEITEINRVLREMLQL
jgi:mRNA interferase MazF